MRNARQGIQLIVERAAFSAPRLLVSFVMLILSALMLFIVSKLR